MLSILVLLYRAVLRNWNLVIFYLTLFKLQVENEYGSFGCDHEYMDEMEKMYRKYLGEDVVLFTTDGDGDGYLKCGATESLYTTVDFGAGGNVKNAFAIQRKYQAHGPFVSKLSNRCKYYM